MLQAPYLLSSNRHSDNYIMDDGQKDLSHEEVWDDSALIDSWNQALDEYKVEDTFRTMAHLERALSDSRNTTAFMQKAVASEILTSKALGHPCLLKPRNGVTNELLTIDIGMRRQTNVTVESRTLATLRKQKVWGSPILSQMST